VKFLKVLGVIILICLPPVGWIILFVWWLAKAAAKAKVEEDATAERRHQELVEAIKSGKVSSVQEGGA
jgi:hypothetical protein